MNYLRLITIPVVAGVVTAGLSSCPHKEPDQTNVAITDTTGQPGTTVVDNSTPAPAGDTHVDVHVTNDPGAPVIVKSDTVKTKYPDVVSVVEREVAAPTVTDNTVYVANAPAIKVWTDQIVPVKAPADVVYRVRDLDVTNATDTEITANGYVLVTSPATGFQSERKYVTYTFQKDPTTSQWLVYNLAVDRTEPATAEDLGTGGAAGGTGAAGGAGDTGGSTGGDTSNGGGSTGGDTGGAGGSGGSGDTGGSGGRGGSGGTGGTGSGG
jgi:hypothetical protein